MNPFIERKTILLAALIAVALLLTACGGSGGKAVQAGAPAAGADVTLQKALASGMPTYIIFSSGT